MRLSRSRAVLTVLVGLFLGGSVQGSDPLDRELHRLIREYDLSAGEPSEPQPPAKVRLGRLLFFDKLLSGNRDIACATCHHPSLATGDALCLPIGTGGVGLGPGRVGDPSRPLVPRNATEIFSRGSSDWTTMFWDTRLHLDSAGSIVSPAGSLLPPGLDNLLAAQAMFPVTGRDEMRGLPGDPGNEIAEIEDGDFPGIWSAIMRRVLAIPAYRRLFARAYPEVRPSALGFEHAANAIAAFEAAAFTRPDSPWDGYLRGRRDALRPAAKRGALLFYGRAGCVSCHSGNLFTDQKAHNLAVPQLGPGKPPSAPLDHGLENLTRMPLDRFCFRTPPLRNVAVTGPWMHNGAYTTLEGAVLHHLDPVQALANFDLSQLPPEIAATVRTDPETLAALTANLDPLVATPRELSPRELKDLLAFLESLTSTSLDELPRLVPRSVPSGLPVDRID